MNDIKTNLTANSIIKTDKYTYDYLSYTPVVKNVHQLLKEQQYQQAIAEFTAIKKQLPLSTLPVNQRAFSRNIFSVDDGYWLSILNWDKHYTSHIHGHPGVAFVYIIDGEIFNQSYTNPPLVATASEYYQTGDYFYHHGDDNRFDNAIHHIHTKKQALSLHFYSDDARTGKAFGAAAIAH